MLRERAAAGPARRSRDPVGQLVAATLPWLAGILVALSLLVVVGAPWLWPGCSRAGRSPVGGQRGTRDRGQPGVHRHRRLLRRGVAAQLVYGPPALINIAMNVGIIGLVLLAHRQWGVCRGAGRHRRSSTDAAGPAAGVRRHIGLPKRPRLSADLRLGAFLPIVSFIAIGQSQVFVERSVAAHLVAGTITRLNYVQKIGQEFTAAALILAVVTYPRVSRAIADVT